MAFKLNICGTDVITTRIIRLELLVIGAVGCRDHRTRHNKTRGFIMSGRIVYDERCTRLCSILVGTEIDGSRVRLRACKASSQIVNTGGALDE